MHEGMCKMHSTQSIRVKGYKFHFLLMHSHAYKHTYLYMDTHQPGSQALSSPESKTLVGSGHAALIFWVVTNKINVYVRSFW